MTITDSIKKRIEGLPYGSAFVVSDFLDIAPYESTKKILTRLEKAGDIRRVLRGIYDKPRFSSLLQEYSAPDPEEVAKAIARNYNWSIFPSGNTALNLLGLSTQVPADWTYISSGPYKTYAIGKIAIIFLHRADREVSGMSYMTGLVIGAIKAIGKENISDSDIRQIRSRLTDSDKEALMKEGQRSSIWIYSAIKEICQEGNKQDV